MKNIQPISIWIDGSVETATLLSAKIILDNLLDEATFAYYLYKQGDNPEFPIVLSNGNLDIEGQEYLDWGTSQDINEAAYVWIADQLNLTLV